MELRILKRVSLCFLLVGFCLNSHSQRQTLVGLNINGEIYPDEFRPGIGVVLERQFTKHSGLESGLFYRTQLSTGIITYTDASGSHASSFTVAQRHVNLSVLYEYYSHLVNVSAGPAFDFYLGWKQKEDEFPFPMKSYDVSPKIKVGFLTKVSKVCPLSKQFVLEPEIRFGSVHTLDEAGIGIGLAGKYRF